MWKAEPRDHSHKRYEIAQKRAEKLPVPDGEAARSVISDDGLITVSAMHGVPLAFFGMKEIRERQADLIQDKLILIADRSKGRVAVSLADVHVLTSSGINALVAVNSHCRKLGGHLVLFAVAPEVEKMIHVTKLDRTLVIVANAHEAVRSFTEGEKRRGFFASAFSWARQEKDAA